MLGLDRFRRINDDHSRLVGDAVLREFGHIVPSHVRGEDVAARIGGEEFLIILPDALVAQTLDRAAQIRTAGKRLAIQYQYLVYGDLSIAAGIAMGPEHGTNAEDLVRSRSSAGARQGGRLRRHFG